MRLQFLNRFFDAVDGQRTAFGNINAVGNNLGLDHWMSIEVAQNLTDEGFIQSMALRGDYQLTSKGQRVIEQARLALEKPPMGFNATSLVQAQTIIINGSQVQFGTVNSAQTQQIGLDTQALEHFLGDLTNKLAKLQLSSADEATIRAQITTIEHQKDQPERTPIVQSALGIVKEILSKAAIQVGMSLVVDPLLHQLALMGIH